MPPEPSAPAKPGSPPPAKLRHLVAGPVVFAVLLLIPVGGLAFETRGAMGLLVWMAWWWITRPVHLAVTGLLPLPIAAVFGLAPMDEVATSYAQDTILLLLGANILTSVWTRWGLDRRIGLASLLGVGTDARRQILVWFLVSAALSGVPPEHDRGCHHDSDRRRDVTLRWHRGPLEQPRRHGPRNRRCLGHECRWGCDAPSVVPRIS